MKRKRGKKKKKSGLIASLIISAPLFDAQVPGKCAVIRRSNSKLENCLIRAWCLTTTNTTGLDQLPAIFCWFSAIYFLPSMLQICDYTDVCANPWVTWPYIRYIWIITPTSHMCSVWFVVLISLNRWSDVMTIEVRTITVFALGVREGKCVNSELMTSGCTHCVYRKPLFTSLCCMLHCSYGTEANHMKTGW